MFIYFTKSTKAKSVKTAAESVRIAKEVYHSIDRVAKAIASLRNQSIEAGGIIELEDLPLQLTCRHGKLQGPVHISKT